MPSLLLPDINEGMQGIDGDNKQMLQEMDGEHNLDSDRGEKILDNRNLGAIDEIPKRNNHETRPAAAGTIIDAYGTIPYQSHASFSVVDEHPA